MADSLIRLRQLNKPEVSGYIIDVVDNFISTGTAATGALTGAFYPLKSNPSGYLTTGNVVLRTETGNFVDQSRLNSSNASLLTGLTVVYYPLTNPSGFITGLNTGSFISSSQTGNFITTGQTGAFGTVTNTGILTGAFYPLKSNPSGYLTTGQTGAFGVGSTGLLTGSFYPRYLNPSDYINSGIVGQASGSLQSQIETVRTDYAKLTSITQNITAKSYTFGDFTLDGFVGGFKIADNNTTQYPLLYDAPTEILSTPESFTVGEVLTVNNYIKNIGKYIDTGSVTAMDTNSRELSGNWSVQNLQISGLPVLNKTAADLLYYDISNSSNFSTKTYVNANFAPITDYVSLSSIIQNTKLRLRDTVLGITPLNYVEGKSFFLQGSGDVEVLDVYGTNHTGNSTLTTKRVLSSTGVISEFYADSIYLDGVPIKQAVSGTPVTGGFVSMTDDNHNVRANFYDTGSLTSRFRLGSGLNDEFYLQYYYVYPNTSTALKSKIDLANQTIDGFNITSNSIKVGGYDVLTTLAYTLYDPIQPSVAWASRNLYDNVGFMSVDWQNRRLYSSTEDVISLDWNSARLYNPVTFTITMDWSGKQLVGNWTAGGLSINGNDVLTGFNSGIYITTGQTGAFGGGNTGALTGAFYPLKSNPSSYAQLGVGVITNDQFVLYDYSSEGPALYFSQYPSGFYLQNPVNPTTKINFNAGTIANFSGSFTGATISGNRVTTGGPYYPLNSNPSGYLTSSAGGGVTGITGITIGDGTNLTGLVSFSGYGITIGRSGNMLQFSGFAAQTQGGNGSILVGTYNIPSGTLNTSFIQFSQALSGSPYIVGSLYNNSGNGLLAFGLSGASTTGFYLNLSETTSTPYYSFNYIATASSGFINFASGGASSSSSLAFIPKSGDYTMTSTDDVVLANSSGTTVLLSLPSASTVSGKTFRIKRINSGQFNVIISGTSIDGETGVSLVSRNQSLTVSSDGSGYYTF